MKFKNWWLAAAAMFFWEAGIGLFIAEQRKGTPLGVLGTAGIYVGLAVLTIYVVISLLGDAKKPPR